MYQTIISAEEVYAHLDDPNWVIVDCRYHLSDKSRGRSEYLKAHIPGAVFADVHDDLSGPPLTDQGRHPMPSADQLNRLFGRLGIKHNDQVVCYDATAGAFAGRLWWLLRYMSHDAVAVLDGGWQAWEKAGYPKEAGQQTNPETAYQGKPRTRWLIKAEEVPDARLLIDSREPARYLGLEEPIDKAAGHIPGAVNHYWQDNLTSEGTFKSAAELRAQFSRLFNGAPAEDAVFYCGSGVTACHNLLALAQAGMPAARLYAGSWSDWCSDPQRPIATGEATELTQSSNTDQ